MISEFLFGQQFHCSAFVLAKDGILLAKNFDWELGNGLIVLNPKGKLKKVSIEISAAGYLSFIASPLNTWVFNSPSGQ